jgi:hypothetical protein
MLTTLQKILSGEQDISPKTRKRIVIVAALATFACLIMIFPQGRRFAFGVAEAIIRHPLGNHDLRDWMLLTGGLAGFFAFYAVWRIFLPKITEWREDTSQKTETKLILGGIALILAYALAGTYFCALSDSLWDDEFLTVNTIVRPWNEVLRIESADVHPPLYFLMLKAWATVFGGEVFTLKLFSVFPAILTMLALWYFLLREFSAKAAFFAILAFAAAAGNCHYFVEVRMYTWALFFTTCAAIAMYRVAKTNNLYWWLALLLSVEAAAYTHYYAAASVALGGGLFFVWFLRTDRKRLPHIVGFAVAAAALYLPWVPLALGAFSQTDGAFWTQPIRLPDALACFTNYFWAGGEGLTPFFALLAVAVFASFFIRPAKPQKEFFAVAASAVCVLLALVCIAFSLAGRPVYATRYFYPVSGMVWLFFGVAAAGIRNRRLTFSLGALLGALAFASLALAFEYERKEGSAQREFRVWLASPERLGPQLRDTDVFIFPSPRAVFELRAITLFFPKNRYVATNGDETNIDPKTGKLKRWFGDDFYLMYDPAKKFSMETVAANPDKFEQCGAWVFRMFENDALPDLTSLPPELDVGAVKIVPPLLRKKGQPADVFGWGGGQADGYKFFLYYVPSASKFARQNDALLRHSESKKKQPAK